MYHFRWMPGPLAPAELVGGPADGVSFQLPRERDGLPSPVWRVPVQSGPTWAGDVDTWPAQARLEIASYDLVGFRQWPTRWVYRYRASA